MTAPSKNWSDIADTQIDADSPLDTTLMTALRDDLVHIKEWLGNSYTATQDHSHDGANSAPINYANITQTDATILFEDFLGDSLPANLATDGYCFILSGKTCGVMDITIPGDTVGGIGIPTCYGNFNLTSSATLTFEARRGCASAYASLAPGYGFADNVSSGPWNGNQIVFTSNTSANWLAKTVSAGVATTTDTGVAVGSTAWQKLKIVATASIVKFYIDEVLKATHTTNIPTTAGMDIAAFEYRVTSGATFYVDYILASSSIRNN